MVEEKEDKGFRVSDKRVFSTQREETEGLKQGQGVEAKKDEEKTAREEPRVKEAGKAPPLPEVNFSTFILSLNHSALTHFGQLPDPVTKSQEKDLAMAKHTIDIISMLKEKTRGSLTKEEQELIEHILYDLRMRYVKEVSK